MDEASDSVDPATADRVKGEDETTEASDTGVSERNIDGDQASITTEAGPDLAEEDALRTLVTRLIDAALKDEQVKAQTLSGEQLDREIKAVLLGQDTVLDESLESEHRCVHVIMRKRRQGVTRAPRKKVKVGQRRVVSEPIIANVSGEKMRCSKCNVADTPQWRYIHTKRYCNACYMRVKRWVDNNLQGRKLPSRVKSELTAEEDARLDAEATEIVDLAFNSLDQMR